MVGVISKPSTEQKLRILSADAQYDLACACANGNGQRRKQSSDGRWIYPVTLPNGGTSVLFKTLISNVCTNDCKYCPLRKQADVARCSLSPEETAEVFVDYLNQRKVFGLFLTSGVIGSADATMDKLISTAEILRKRHRYRGYIHLKIIPGASRAAIEEALSLSTAVSLNIEVPGEKYLSELSSGKRYIEDVIEPIKYISRLTAKGGKYEGKKQTTQFVVGAAGEPDSDIVKFTHALYQRLGMQRVYFSAYQKDVGNHALLAEQGDGAEAKAALVREHRLYQTDFLLRKYGFGADEIVFDSAGRLSLTADPKEVWAENHPEFFPVQANSALKYQLLRVPGLGHVTVGRILEMRKARKLSSINDLPHVTATINKAVKYLVF